MKTNGKKSDVIIAALRKLQYEGILNFGSNMKSITPDNGSEFWGWEEFRKSIVGKKYDIEIYFTHSYCSWEKGGVENFNSLIRRKFPKGTNFDEINDWEIQEAVDWVNNIYRGSLNYLSANEVYNKWVQVNC